MPRRLMSPEGKLRMYQGGVEIIADMVAKADRGETFRDDAWRVIQSVLSEIERHEKQQGEGY
ncbi:MAG TPA: hypothetical protein VNB86_08150, partial [Gaiellaceae bacterium]|nr:hypothetical protein [Gaiellaceae bacterium]